MILGFTKLFRQKLYLNYWPEPAVLATGGVEDVTTVAAAALQ